MLSNDIISQLVSMSSKLEGIFASDDNITQEKISYLKNITDELLEKNKELSEEEIKILVYRLQDALLDLEETTNKRLKIFEFANFIAPR
jgi:helix-turn-helix protein